MVIPVCHATPSASSRHPALVRKPAGTGPPNAISRAFPKAAWPSFKSHPLQKACAEVTWVFWSGSLLDEEAVLGVVVPLVERAATPCQLKRRTTRDRNASRLKAPSGQ